MADNIELDPNEVMDKLSDQIAGLNRELAMKKVHIDNLQKVVNDQQNLINAYEEQENAET